MRMLRSWTIYIALLLFRRLAVSTSNMHHCSLLSYVLHALSCALSFLVLFTGLSTGAALQSGNALARTHNLTSFPLPLPATPGDYHCARSVDWSAPDFDPRECEAVIDFFRGYEEKLHGHSEYEYIFRGAIPAHPSLVNQMLPRQYRSSQ